MYVLATLFAFQRLTAAPAVPRPAGSMSFSQWPFLLPAADAVPRPLPGSAGTLPRSAGLAALLHRGELARGSEQEGRPVPSQH